MKGKRVLLYLCTALAAVLCTGCCSHVWQEADCTRPKTCQECGKTQGEVGEHSWVEATCTEPRTCSVCGEIEGAAAGHSWTEATCTEPRTCSVCGGTEGAAAGHSWVEATCVQLKTCSACGETTGKLAEHTWESASCTAPSTCSVCGATEGEALGHSWREVTCTEPKTCNRCGETEGESLGHEMNESQACSRCGMYFGTGRLLDFSASKVGDSLFFGQYDQDVEWSNGKEEIEWVVLDKQEDRLLVVSKYTLDSQPYGDSQEANWETSYIRQWLNDAFLYEAFSETEREKILETTISDPDCGNPTTNKIFLLSYDEYQQYEKTIKSKVSIAATELHSYGNFVFRTTESDNPRGNVKMVLHIPGGKYGNVDVGNYSSGGIGGVTVHPAMWIPAMMEIQDEEKAEKEIDSAKLASLSQLQYGDRFTFGTYEMDGIYSNGKEELEWYVLDRQDDKIRLFRGNSGQKTPTTPVFMLIKQLGICGWAVEPSNPSIPDTPYPAYSVCCGIHMPCG